MHGPSHVTTVFSLSATKPVNCVSDEGQSLCLKGLRKVPIPLSKGSRGEEERGGETNPLSKGIGREEEKGTHPFV